MFIGWRVCVHIARVSLPDVQVELLSPRCKLYRFTIGHWQEVSVHVVHGTLFGVLSNFFIVTLCVVCVFVCACVCVFVCVCMCVRVFCQQLQQYQASHDFPEISRLGTSVVRHSITSAPRLAVG